MYNKPVKESLLFQSKGLAKAGALPGRYEHRT